MGKISTYVINLKTSFVRKQYMAELLGQYPFFELQYIEAVDGRAFSDDQLYREFDKQLCLEHYGRILNKGEIGCILSHRRCCQALLSSSNVYALIVEDDIHPMRSLNELQAIDLDSILNVSMPVVLLLSGDYWYYRRKTIVDVYDAVGAYAYFVNRAAASIILSITKPYNVADDWALYKQYGIKLKAIYPYLIDANVNMELLGSDVHQDTWGSKKNKMSKINLIRAIKGGILKRIFSYCGHFESKVRIINNKIVSK